MAERTKAVTKTEEAGGMTIPDFIKQGDVRGTEHITKDDIRPPRLSLAQGLSPQMIETDPLYIEGLKLGDAFNDLTGQIYGKTAIDVLVVRADPPRYVEFDEDGRTIVDRDVPADDPRTQFTDDPDHPGQRLKPVATKFYDFVVLKLPEREPMALSFKSTGLKMAVRLNSLIRMKPVPIFAGRYQLTSVMNKNDQGTWYGFNVRQTGIVQEKDLFDFAEACYTAWKEKRVDFETEAASAEPAETTGGM